MTIPLLSCILFYRMLMSEIVPSLRYINSQKLLTFVCLLVMRWLRPLNYEFGAKFQNLEI
jgi:hypothetical protein